MKGLQQVETILHTVNLATSTSAAYIPAAANGEYAGCQTCCLQL
jgi:hypothetical protein